MEHDIGCKIKAARIEKKLTQEQVAELLGVSRQTISNWESGGNLMSIIRNTADQIGDKIDVKREIDTMLAAKKYEFQVMSVIPFGIVLYMTVSFPEFMGNLYGNIAGRGVMTGCLIIYLGAYGLGRKIIEIEV